ncbi:glycosyl hydrolase [Roridomyces roridus]|uniref:Glycosyl hydrolase n=1 Tax=Roridomyces roridus TaxID=1738132 RepID=A0AAD7FQJ1_9AGAR|nr:glycosyl hydrolase [Roridomyces roridus]
MIRFLLYLSVGLFTVSGQPTPSQCPFSQNEPPGNLTSCPNSSLFSVWRPRARFIAPEGWQNDPQGLFQRRDGSYHAGYQCHPNHYEWGNISQCAATSKDFVYWSDINSWENPKTIWPSDIFDIRGVFDGSVMKNGWKGFPTTIYTATFPAALGSGTDEQEGTETQCLAWTEDDGASWTKLPLGPGNNPVIYQWPMPNLTGFRDPYIFLSPTIASLSSNFSGATGDHFLTVSSGIHGVGPRLFSYRQTSNADVRAWTSFSPAGWSGNWGINFETASVTRLNENGESLDVADTDAVDFIGVGTEGGRGGSHEGHWPLWAMVTYSVATDGSIAAKINAVGPIDWGRAYATVPFSVNGNRSVLVGWAYVRRPFLSMVFDSNDLYRRTTKRLHFAAQRSYQGSFTLFRDLFLKVIRNVDPNTPDLNSPGNWITRNESDGSPFAKSTVSAPAPEAYVPFETQPTGRFYAIQATLSWTGTTDRTQMPQAGFRVLASDDEWTDIMYDPASETLTIDRSKSSLIASYGTETEVAMLRLWPILTGNVTAIQALNLTVIVDNSALEVYANDVAVITTRGFYIGPRESATGGNVGYSSIELWDGLVNAWPDRPLDTSKELINDGPLPGIWGGLWAGL